MRNAIELHDIGLLVRCLGHVAVTHLTMLISAFIRMRLRRHGFVSAPPPSYRRVTPEQGKAPIALRRYQATGVPLGVACGRRATGV